ncbi:MAG: DUF58 domain-containing protein [Rhodocyclaceae bacterium]|nr:DUF58 domain-containing protein [Rhodocyclaceae bacterium]
MPMAAARPRIRQWLDARLFRIRPREPLPVRLGHRRIFVLPTGLGLAFAATLFTMLLASMNYALSLGYAVTFLLVGAGFVSLHQTFRNLLAIELVSARLDTAFCGSDAALELVFVNPSGRPRQGLEVSERGSLPVRFDIGPEAAARVVVPIPAQRRGWLEPRRLTLETRFPLGLVRGWSYLTPPARALVYPRPEAPVPPLPADSETRHPGTLGESGEEDFAGLREYRQGDSPRRIAWKLAARHGAQLHTKVFAGGQASSLQFDWHALPAGLDVETRLSRLTAWVIQAAGSHVPFGLRLPDFECPPARGQRHVDACLKALALHGRPDAKT